MHDMLARTESFSPREWVLNNMTCHHAVAIIHEHLRRAAETLGEGWDGRHRGPEPVLSDTQRYCNPVDCEGFDADFRFLESRIV